MGLNNLQSRWKEKIRLNRNGSVASAKYPPKQCQFKQERQQQLGARFSSHAAGVAGHCIGFAFVKPDVALQPTSLEVSFKGYFPVMVTNWE